MKTFLHILYTWILTVSLLLGGLLIYGLAVEDFQIYEDLRTGMFIAVVFIVLLLSLPAFFLSWLMLVLISNWTQSIISKIIFWYGSVLFAVVVNFLVFLLFTSMQEISLDTMFIQLWPVYAAVYIVVTIRLKWFILLMTSNQEEKIIINSDHSHS